MNRGRMAAGARMALGVVVVGCDKTSAGPGAGPAGTSAPASNLPVKGPWEAIKITMTRKDPNGTTHFKVENVGSRTVTQIYIDLYGYDAKGKQVTHKDVGFSLPIKGGASDELTREAVKDVETWEAVYHGIGFEGDAKETMDYKRAPAQRAKGAAIEPQAARRRDADALPGQAEAARGRDAARIGSRATGDSVRSA